MQPQELHPNLHSVVTPSVVRPTNQTSPMRSSVVVPTVPTVIATTDEMIAKEKARVYSFQHGAPELEKQHKVLDFIGMHKRTLLIGVMAFILLSSGGTFAFLKLKSFTNSPDTQSSSVATGSKSSSSGGGAAVTGSGTGESASGESSDTDGSSSSDTSEGSGGEDNNEGENGDDGTGGEENNDSVEEIVESDPPEIDENGEPIVNDVESDAPIETPASTPVPSTPSPVLPHKYTTASWNSNADNTKIVGDQVLTLMNDAQVLGVQSLHHLDQRDSVKNKVICSSCKYAGYLPSYTDSKATQSSYPIIWNKTSFTQVGSGSWRKMSDSLTVGTTTYAARYATWTRLQSRVNGKQIIVVNTHLISSVESSGKPTSNTGQLDRYKTHMNNLIALINELKSSNVPLYIVGNFSVNFRYDKNGYTSYFPYAALKPLAVRSNWDVMNLSGISSTTGTTTADNHLVDYVFSWQRSDVTANSITIAASSYGSSYKPVFYTTTIK